MSDKDATQEWKEVELATGKTVKVPLALVEDIDELNKGNLRQADYTRKRQKAAEWEAQLAKREADIAVTRERINVIERNPRAKAAFEALTQDPYGAQNLLDQPPQAPQDPFTDTQPASVPAGIPVGNPEVARLQAMVGQLSEQMNESQRRSADSAVEAELISAYGDNQYIEHDAVRAHLNGNPSIWNLSAKEQVRSTVLALYGDRVLEDARRAGRTELQREIDAQRETDDAEAAQAANSPTQFVMPDTGETVPDMETLARMVRTDPEKAKPYMLAIERQMAREAEEAARVELDGIPG